VPPAIVPAIEAIVGGGAIVTVSSRSIAGRVKPRYGYEGGGLMLQRAGAILAGDLSGASARLLQMVALGFTSDLAEAREIIRRTCE
jgi:L-asparaginase